MGVRIFEESPRAQQKRKNASVCERKKPFKLVRFEFQRSVMYGEPTLVDIQVSVSHVLSWAPELR